MSGNFCRAEIEIPVENDELVAVNQLVAGKNEVKISREIGYDSIEGSDSIKVKDK